MPNEIPTKQNSLELMRLIYAYHQAYANANQLAILRFGLVTAIALVVPLFGAFVPVFRPYGALMSLAMFLLDLFYFEKQIDHDRRLGAKLQELFDRTLFGLSWPENIVGEKPTFEVVGALSAKYAAILKPERQNKLQNWYPTQIENLQKPIAVLICQRSNCVWDADLRKTYVRILYAGILLLMAVGALVAILLKMTVPDFLLTFTVPTLPAIAFVWRVALSQTEAISSSHRTRRALDSVRQTAMANKYSADVLDAHIDYLQAEIFDRRSTISRVPAIIYDRYREKLEGEMKQAVDSMIADASETVV